jgi:hypothetical protein
MKCGKGEAIDIPEFHTFIQKTDTVAVNEIDEEGFVYHVLSELICACCFDFLQDGLELSSRCLTLFDETCGSKFKG